MNRLCALVATLAFVSILAPAPGEAAALACGPVTPFGPNPPMPPGPVVFQTLSWWAPGTLCGGAPVFTSLAPACPPLVGPQPGEYCGPLKFPGTAALCEIAPATPLFFGTQLFVGWDTNFDGHVLPAESPLWGPIAPFTGAWAIPNPGVPARVIAYPTNVGGVGPIPIDANFVTCV